MLTSINRQDEGLISTTPVRRKSENISFISSIVKADQQIKEMSSDFKLPSPRRPNEVPEAMPAMAQENFILSDVEQNVQNFETLPVERVKLITPKSE